MNVVPHSLQQNKDYGSFLTFYHLWEEADGTTPFPSSSAMVDQ